MFGWFGSPKEYAVDYCGKKALYTHAKDYYRAGEKVTVYYYMVDPELDYDFYINGEKITHFIDEENGLKINFTMPKYDIKLQVRGHKKENL